MYICYQLRDSNLSIDDVPIKDEFYPSRNFNIKNKPLIHDEIFYKKEEEDKDRESEGQVGEASFLIKFQELSTD